MPVIKKGEDPSKFGLPFSAWGLANFSKGAKNPVEPHFHDCDEYWFILKGKIKAKSEGTTYMVEAGDVLYTKMGDEHEIIEVLEDSTIFWVEGELKGKKRKGHLHRGVDESSF